MPENPDRRSGQWFRPVGVDLRPQRSKPIPSPIPRAAQPAVARGARFLAILALIVVLLLGVVVGLVLHPVATVAWFVGWTVVGLLVRIAWRASR